MVNISVLEKFGVDVSAFQRIEEAPTSSTILNIRPNGERPALHLRGASDYFLPPSKEKFNIWFNNMGKQINFNQIKQHLLNKWKKLNF